MTELVSMRLDPRQISATRASIDDSLTDLGQQLRRVEYDGFVRESGLGDGVSSEMARAYNDRIAGPDRSIYSILRAYEGELIRVRDQLVALEESYRAAEAVAELWRHG